MFLTTSLSPTALFVIGEVNLTEDQWKYWISPKTLSLIAEAGWAKYPKETGGILIGWQLGRIFYIETAIGPGPNAIHKNNGFKRGGDFSQSQLDSIVLETHGQWDYLGEWHSHPHNVGPSSIDNNSMKKVQTSPEFNMLQPILGLIINDRRVWHFHCYMLSQNQRLIEIPRQEVDNK